MVCIANLMPLIFILKCPILKPTLPVKWHSFLYFTVGIGSACKSGQKVTVEALELNLGNLSNIKRFVY